ncbi:uncharacterized protein LOC144112583 [Amblyomma americanum]
MVKLVAVLFLFGADLALSGKDYNGARDQSLHVQVDDSVKECWYRGYNLTKNIPKHMETPCERWTCRYKNHYPRVVVDGCDPVIFSERYVEEVSQNPENVFPKCCGRKK